MTWILLTIFAQAIFAVVVLVDRFMVSTPAINKPVVYAFYNNILLLVVVGLLPFGVIAKPTLEVLELSLLGGVVWAFAIFFLYRALKISEASDISPVFAAVSAVAAFGLSFIFSFGWLTGNLLAGFILLIIGTLLMSYLRFTGKSLLYVCLGGFLYALFSIFLKEIFSQTTFWNGIFWVGLGGAVGALSFLLAPSNRADIRGNLKQSSAGVKMAVVLNKVMAGVASFFVFYAIKLGNVSVINALSGVQFVFLLLFALVFSGKFPEYFSETTHKKTVLQKSIATAIIVAGLALLFVD
jgi:drug/metabolite transporter (DMT)-like permease